MSDPVRIIIGDVRDGLRSLAAGSVQCCVTSPPYWGLRDYGVDGQIGLEATPERFVETMVEVFGEVRRVLRDDGTLWLNLGDSYASSGRSDRKESPGVGAKQEMSAPGRVLAWEPGGGHNYSWSIPTSSGRIKPKDLCMIPWRVALALQADGWWIRSVIVWAKKSPMPESVTDRPTSAWEPIFLLAKSDRYFYDAEAVKERLESGDTRPPHGKGQGTMPGQRAASGSRMPPIGGAKHAGSNGNATYSGNTPEWPSGRNMRNVWTLSAEHYSEAHFATFPSEIPRRAIRAGTSEKGCCPACGTPWERVVERTYVNPGNRTTNGTKSATKNTGALGGCGYDVRLELKSCTVGWEPGCACPPAEPVPCVVLDPFLGSGTTIAAARQLGRHGVGIELNPTYADMARVRIGKAEKPHTFMDHREPAEKGLFT